MNADINPNASRKNVIVAAML